MGINLKIGCQIAITQRQKYVKHAIVPTSCPQITKRHHPIIPANEVSFFVRVESRTAAVAS